jgi:hypothetical protein
MTAPLVFAAPAQAGPVRQEAWDRGAQCESGGNWRANTGNGYYGGLQFNRGTWHSYGGGAYAGTANQATRLQQIEIAEKVLSAQGGTPGRAVPEGPASADAGHTTRSSPATAPGGGKRVVGVGRGHRLPCSPSQRREYRVRKGERPQWPAGSWLSAFGRSIAAYLAITRWHRSAAS